MTTPCPNCSREFKRLKSHLNFCKAKPAVAGTSKTTIPQTPPTKAARKAEKKRDEEMEQEIIAELQLKYEMEDVDPEEIEEMIAGDLAEEMEKRKKAATKKGNKTAKKTQVKKHVFVAYLIMDSETYIIGCNSTLKTAKQRLQKIADESDETLVFKNESPLFWRAQSDRDIFIIEKKLVDD